MTISDFVFRNHLSSRGPYKYEKLNVVYSIFQSMPTTFSEFEYSKIHWRGSMDFFNNKKL